MKLVFTIVDLMAHNTPFSLAPMLKKEKLAATGSSYADWVRTLRLVLRSAKKEYVLDTPLPKEPEETTAEDEKNV
jgi:hypothetical protein